MLVQGQTTNFGNITFDYANKLWYTMVEKVIIASKEEVNFHFKNGAVLSI